MTSKFQTPKGFRDFLPRSASRRRIVLEKITRAIERFGFEPLETSAVEFSETLKGKYGEDEKLIFEFTDRGGRQVALRFDQTVPLARVIASNPILPLPFKRYQIQSCWRAENPQKGRFREFLQVDFDTVGTSSLLADAEIIACAIACAKEIGLSDIIMRINDREIFRGLSSETIRAIDKLQKIGENGVIEQLKREGYKPNQAKSLLKKIEDSKPTAQINELFKLMDGLGVDKAKYAFDPTLSRGLDYYTGTIFELEIEGYAGGSIGGGGRYDNLIGRFTERKTPAVGFSFGFDRLMEACEEANLLPIYLPPTKVLVTIFNEGLLPESLSLVSKLRNQGIAAESALDPSEKLEKQLKYADKKGVPYTIILGPEEVKTNTVTLKNLASGEQKQFKLSEIIKILRSSV